MRRQQQLQFHTKTVFSQSLKLGDGLFLFRCIFTMHKTASFFLFYSHYTLDLKKGQQTSSVSCYSNWNKCNVMLIKSAAFPPSSSLFLTKFKPLNTQFSCAHTSPRVWGAYVCNVLSLLEIFAKGFTNYFTRPCPSEEEGAVTLLCLIRVTFRL